MSDLTPADYFRVRQEIERRRLAFYRPYKKQQEFHKAGALYRERLLRAGNQCCLFSNWVECPDSKSRLCGELFFDSGSSVLAWDGDKQCTSHIDRGHLKGIEPAFRVVLDSGHFFDCSSSHEILSEEGYISLHELCVRAGGLRLWQKAEDYMGNCLSFGYLYGGPLPSFLDTDREESPLSGGVPPRSLCLSYSDAMARIPLHIRHRLDSGHLPIFGDEVDNFWDLFSLFSAPYVPQPVLPLLNDSQEFSQLPFGLLSLLRSGTEALPDPGSPLALMEHKEFFCAGDMLAPNIWKDQGGEQSLFSLFLASSTQESAEDVSQLAIFFPYAHTPLVGGQKIISVVFLGYQPIIDCQVPVVNNYKAAGVYHHNCGKTMAAAAETAMHALGRYPDWWEGRVFKKAPVIWCAGVTGEVVRDSIQRLLIGDTAGNPGFILKEDVQDVLPSRGVADLADTILVKHISGGTSRIRLKYYEQGREKFQADTVDAVWLDEECDEGIYTEALTRTNATKGMLYMTFTPLKGMSEVVRRFLIDPSVDRHDTNMTIMDVGHIAPEERERIIQSYPAHEREARLNGTPMLGSGRIFPIPESEISVKPFNVMDMPWYWMEIAGIDFGWDHPTAAAKILYDPQGDVVYVTNVYKRREATPLIHAAALKPWGRELQWAWPHDGLQHDKGSGIQLKEQYQEQGLKMLGEKATFDDERSNGVEAGIAEMLMRMESGRFKVFCHLTEFFEEFRLYHRKEGKVVKEYDDVICAVRHAIMMLRYAKPIRPPAHMVNNTQGGHVSNYNPLSMSYVKKQLQERK